MRDEQFKVVSGKRRQHSLNLGDEKLKQMRSPKKGLFSWFTSLFTSKKTGTPS